MKQKNLLSLTISLALLVLLSTGCGSAPRPILTSADTSAKTPTHAPVATNTITPVNTLPPSPSLNAQLEGSGSVVTSDTINEWEIYLTASSISGVALDDKLIWAASNGGLLRWDRETGKVTQYLSPRFPLPSNHLSHVLLHNDKLYISGVGGLAVFDRENQWTLYQNDDIGLEIGFHAPMVVVNDMLWIAGKGGLARLSPSGRWEVLYADERFLPTDNFDKLVALDDELYIVVALGPTVSSERQVVRFADGVWEIVDRPTLAYLGTPDGNLWKGKDGTLLKSTDQGVTWKLIFESDRFINPRVYDAQGRLYVSTNDTIHVLEEDQITETYRFTDQGPELNYINILKWDDSGRLWIATDGRGLSMFDGECWHNWQPESSDIREDAIRGLAVVNNKVYAGTFGSAASGGVNVLDTETEQWINFWPGESSLSGGGVGGIAVDSQDSVYLPTAVGILDIYDGKNWKHISMPLPQDSFLATNEGLFDENGDYWVATSELGLWRYDGTDWFIYGIPGEINALAIDQAGRLWVGCSVGLVVRDLNKDWHLYTSDELPFGDYWIKDIAIDAKDRVWIVTRNTLVVFNGQEYQVFSPETVGARYWGDALAFDQKGNLWVEVSAGLVQFKGNPQISPFSGFGLPAKQKVSENELIEQQ